MKALSQQSVFLRVETLSRLLTSIVLPDSIHDTHEDVQDDLASIAAIAEIDASKLGSARCLHVGAGVTFLLVIAGSPDRHGKSSNKEKSSPSTPNSTEASVIDGESEEQGTKDLEEPVEQTVERASAQSEESSVERVELPSAGKEAEDGQVLSRAAEGHPADSLEPVGTDEVREEQNNPDIVS